MTPNRPNSQTVGTLFDIAWRIADTEASTTDSLDRKAATLATFSSLLTSLTSTLGVRLVGDARTTWALVLFLAVLLALVAAAAFSVQALLPREHVSFSMTYVSRLPLWPTILKTPEEIRGEAIRGLVDTVARERALKSPEGTDAAQGVRCPPRCARDHLRRGSYTRRKERPEMSERQRPDHEWPPFDPEASPFDAPRVEGLPFEHPEEEYAAIGSVLERGERDRARASRLGQ